MWVASWSCLAFPGSASAWSIQRVPAPQGATSVRLFEVSCASGHACTALGDSSAGPLIERWNGHQWSIQTPAAVPTGDSASLSAVSCISSTDCVAVGRLDAPPVPYSPPGPAPLVERWNGSAWSIQGASGTGEFSAVSCSPSVCMAVGTGSGGEPMVARWGRREGLGSSTWQFDLFWNTVSCTSRGICAVMGAGFVSPGPDACQGVDVAFGGSSGWSVRPLAGCNDLQPDSVSCTSPTACTAVFGSAIYGWNGHRWMIEPNALRSDETLVGVSCVGGAACVGVDGAASATRGSSW